MGGEDGWGCWVVAVRDWGLTACEALGMNGETLMGAYKSQAQAVIAGYFFSSSDGFATLGSVSLITLGARLITQGGLV
ncbi:hypothetical protein ALP21_200369 [Pseudomonas savastanoi pv. phaseolicola]|nr:hypothetical protein ALP21_200369 [Pseudomonas savastanoi pv. phaseolicola]